MDALREIQREVDACSCERGRLALSKWMNYARLVNATDPYMHHNAMLYSGLRSGEDDEQLDSEFEDLY